jgi:hypothetical protein
MAEKQLTIEVVTSNGMVYVHQASDFRVTDPGALIIFSGSNPVAAYPAGQWYRVYETGNLLKK